MTKEMLNIIIKLALTRLLNDDIDELQLSVEWITKDMIEWCLCNYKEALQEDESIKSLMRRAVLLLEKGGDSDQKWPVT